MYGKSSQLSSWTSFWEKYGWGTGKKWFVAPWEAPAALRELFAKSGESNWETWLAKQPGMEQPTQQPTQPKSNFPWGWVAVGLAATAGFVGYQMYKKKRMKFVNQVMPFIESAK
jgi:hypothetical protein